ncbi:hypothetical protein HYZ99_00775 [Candidatus Peregrinibacteria bacterium]|nr:hypothetical protein [Candidatus Peregrinibacteria bacterium]
MAAVISKENAMNTFVYHPRSGNRIFAQKVTASFAVITWANQSAHLAGDHVHLQWWTAAPCDHWRATARRALTEIVEQVGGVAWDDQGVVHVCAPLEDAIDVFQLMDQLDPLRDRYPHENRQANLTVLFRASMARIVKREGGLQLEPSYVPQPSRRIVSVGLFGDHETRTVHTARILFESGPNFEEDVSSFKEGWSITRIQGEGLEPYLQGDDRGPTLL